MSSITHREDGQRFRTVDELVDFCKEHPEYTPIEYGVRYARKRTSQEEIEEHARYLDIKLELIQVWDNQLTSMLKQAEDLKSQIPNTKRAIEGTKRDIEDIRKRIAELEDKG